MEKVSNGKIRVLEIGMHDQMGGIENFLMNYYRELKDTDIQMDFLIPYKDGGYYDEEIESFGGKVYKLTFKNDKNIFKFQRDLDLFFKTHKFDIIHCSDTGLGYFYLKYAKKNGCKIRIAHSHASASESGLKGFIKTILMHAYVKEANVYFACSHLAGDYMFPNKKYKVISNSIDYNKYKFNLTFRKDIRTRLNYKDTDIVIGNIGRLSEQKNQTYILKILYKLPQNFKLLIIGEGPKEGELSKLIDELELNDRVKIMRPLKEINEYYNCFDLFVLSSLYEGLPVVGIESQVNGLHCLFSDTITKEVNFTNNIDFKSLNSPEKWIDRIENCDKKRISNIPDDYNILQTASLLKKEYYRLEDEYGKN